MHNATIVFKIKTLVLQLPGLAKISCCNFTHFFYQQQILRSFHYVTYFNNYSPQGKQLSIRQIYIHSFHTFYLVTFGNSNQENIEILSFRVMRLVSKNLVLCKKIQQ